MARRIGDAGATFNNIWSAFNAQPDRPCSNNTFSNQCAIRVSNALMECDVDLGGFPGTRCWGDSSQYNKMHIIRAQEFGVWLRRGALRGLGATETIRPSEYQNSLRGRRGIIFFKDYWQRRNESPANRSGDHIDLWNANRTTGYWWGWTRDFAEWLRDDISDRNNAREIWFWRIP